MSMEKLTEIVRRVMSSPGSQEVRESSRFVEDLGFSSVNVIMLIALIEQEFCVDLDAHMARLMEIHTVGAAASFIEAVTRGSK